MNKQQQDIMDEFVNRRNGKALGASCYNINGVEFTRAEFEKRARELGWINGYKYGVEYETNGKKPDLPDDVVVDIRIDNTTYKNSWRSECTYRLPPDKISAIEFDYDVTAFRIVDQRYKPVEVVSEIPEKQQNVSVLSENNQKTENVSDWLPPIGTKCLYSLGDSDCWYECTIISHNKLVICCPHIAADCDSGNGLMVAGDLTSVKFKPL